MIPEPRRRCLEGCGDIATHGILGGRALRCEAHKLAGDADLVQKACVKCGLPNVVDAKGLCAVCDPAEFKRVSKRFQEEIHGILKAQGHGDYIVYDQPLYGGKYGLERPDWAWDCGTHILVLECDEKQHKSRLEWCECARMLNISGYVAAHQASVAGSSAEPPARKPVLFLRYNPHAFENAQGRVASIPMRERTKILLRWLAHYKKQRNDLPVIGIAQLFFDGFDPGAAAGAASELDIFSVPMEDDEKSADESEDPWDGVESSESGQSEEEDEEIERPRKRVRTR